MALIKETEIQTNYLENWPMHYYEIPDINLREDCLLEILNKDPDSQDDIRRLEILRKRYGKVRTKRPDLFMNAWLMIKVSGNERPSFLTRKTFARELRANLAALCLVDYEQSDVLVEEWEDFAKTCIKSFASSKTYRSAVFGLLQVGDRNTALRIASDIIEVTRTIPSWYGYEKEAEPLYHIMKNAYLRLIENGDAYWDEVQSR